MKIGHMICNGVYDLFHFTENKHTAGSQYLLKVGIILLQCTVKSGEDSTKPSQDIKQ